MAKIPENAQYLVPNNSDLFGNIHYTKNINFDEEGYAKLSPRMVALKTNDGDITFGLPLAFGRINFLSMNVVTDLNPEIVALAESSVTVTQDNDTDAPSFTVDSHGAWFHNLWHATSDTDFHAKAGSVWADKGNLTTAKAHPIEVFRSRDSICFGNGNVVTQYTESGGSYSSSTSLTLPSDYEVVGLSYSNYQMGIVTILSDGVSGQNQEAYFFTWSGASTSASQGVSTGSEKVFDIVPYKGSWVILTKTGQLLFWTGGGFRELTSLPFYYKDLLFNISSGRSLLGDIMHVDGDLIYINFNGLLHEYGPRFERYLQNGPGGILCYDPKVGIYHRFSPSVSPISMLTVTSANVNTTTNILTKTAGTIPVTGSPIKYTYNRTTPIGGLQVNKVYYCIKLSASTFQLATSKELALAGSAIDLTTTGDTNNYFMALDLQDFGASFGANFGGISNLGFENSVCRDFISGATLNDSDSTTQYKYMCLVVPGFENRGYLVTAKLSSSQIEDVLQKIFSKYRPLKSGDSIVVKYKNKDIIGLPVSTPQGLVGTGVNNCSWTAANSFYTTADLSDALTAFTADEELECEVIAGAAAGTLTQIQNIEYSSGTYVVTLEENVDGASSGKYCDIIIDNWKKIGTITSSDSNGYKEFPVAKNSKWTKFKIELRGTDVTLEEAQPINSTHLPAK